jgi:hypothetical protein
MPDTNTNTNAARTEAAQEQLENNEQPQMPEAPQLPPERPDQIQEQTVSKVESVYASEFKSAQTYEERLRIVDKIHPPLHPEAAIELLFEITPDRDKGLIFKILDKVESAIGPELTSKDDTCVFEKVLPTPDSQLVFIKKLHDEGISEHIVPLLKHAASDDVREALLRKMKEKFESEDDLLEAMKTTRNTKVMSLIMDRVPEDGLSPETVETIKNDPEIDAGQLGNIFKNLKAKNQSEERFQKSGPEVVAEKATGPFKKIFGWIGNTWNNFTSGIKSFFGIKSGGITMTQDIPEKEKTKED